MARTASRGGWGWFVAWLAVGVMWVLTVLGAFTIGIVVLPIAVGGTIFLATRRHAGNGIAGLISGLSNPWPWLAIGVALVILGAFVFIASGA